MPRGFFGNLIFAIIARMLCGNHLNCVHRENSVCLRNEYIISELCNRAAVSSFQSKFKQPVNQDIYDFLYSHDLSIKQCVHFVRRSYDLITLELKGFQNREAILTGQYCRYKGFCGNVNKTFPSIL